MIHERWRRVLTTWRREAGRIDGVWPKEGTWSCGEQIGAWGVSTLHQTSIQKLNAGHVSRRETMLARHKAELAELERQHNRWTARLNAKAERKLEHQKHIEVVDRGASAAIEFVDGRDRIELVRFVGTRADFIRERRIKKRGEHTAGVLINGDGFDDARMQAIQAELRQTLQREFGLQGVMVIPHMALDAAGIDKASVRRIVVTRDGGENVVVKVEGPPEKAWKEVIEPVAEVARKKAVATKSEKYWSTAWVAYDVGKRKYQVRHVHSYGSDQITHQMWRQPQDGVWGWGNISHTKQNGWHTTEWRHRLGGSVFTGVDAQGQRQHFISGFDMQENPPLYFLAQLPQPTKVVATYEQALDLLAPPIVHKARYDGKEVFRHGDVFFIETDLTKYKLHKRKARITTGNGRGRHSDRPRRGRNIYQTGHIATEVALMPNGVTLASGTVEHYPAFTEPGRRPEHQALQLTPGKWFLCIRNTVPRAQDSPTPLDTEQLVNGQSTQLVEGREVDATIAA